MEEQTPYTGPPPPIAPPPAPPSSAPGEPMNPWFTIWVAPRATMRHILDTNPRRMVHLLAMLGGAAESLDGHVPEPVSQLVPLSVLVSIKVLLGAVVGLIALYLISFLVKLTGGWIGGKGDFTSVRAALAWSNVPTIWALLLLLPLFIFMGTEALNFDPGMLFEEPGGVMLLVPMMFIGLIVGIWQIVIMLKCVGEAHRFTAWHALAAAILACMIIAVPFGLLAVVGMMIFFGSGLLPG